MMVQGLVVELEQQLMTALALGLVLESVSEMDEK